MKEKYLVLMSMQFTYILKDFDIDVFLHSNDLSYTGNPEEELKKYKKGDS